eukprot:Platyproteum_vivax@DN4697_c0_g1_i1.p1
MIAEDQRSQAVDNREPSREEPSSEIQNDLANPDTQKMTAKELLNLQESVSTKPSDGIEYDWLSQLRHLKNVETELYEECHRIWEETLDESERDQLSSEQEALGQHQEEWRNDFWTELSRIRKRIKALDNVQDMTNEEQMHAIATATVHEIEKFKNKACVDFESLLEEDSALQTQINLMNDLVDKWSHVPEPPRRLNSQATDQAPDLDSTQKEELRQKILDVDARILAKGGRTGGWKPATHAIYTTIQSTHEGNPKFLEILQNYLPDKDSASLQSHIKWSKSYEEDLKRKKQLLDKWKKLRKNKSGGNSRWKL